MNRLAAWSLLAAATVLGGAWFLLREGPTTPEAPRPEAPPSKSETRPEFGIRGRILDDLGLPIAGANVFTIPTGNPSNEALAKRTQTGADGYFRLHAKRTGTAMLVVRRERTTPRVIASRLELGPTTSTDLGVIELPEAPGLLVEVRGVDGRPLAGAMIELRPGLLLAEHPTAFHALWTTTATTASDGIATFYDVIAGPWTITAAASRHATARREHVQPARPSQAPRATLRLNQGRTLRCRVRSADGKPVADAVISAIPRGNHDVPALTGRTDSLGRFRAEGLPAGPIEVVVAHPTGRLRRATNLPSQNPLELTLEPGQELIGTIRDDRDGTPLPDANIELMLSGAWTMPVALATLRARSDAEGKFRFRGVPLGIVRLRAWSKGLCPWASEPLAIGSKPGDPISISLRVGASATGIVQNSFGRPEPSAVITAIPIDPQTSSSRLETLPVRAAASGRYQLRGLCPGRYRLRVQAPEWAPYIGSPFVVAALPTTGEPSTQDLGSVRLVRGVVISGTAYGTAGAPAVAATVHLRLNPRPPEPGSIRLATKTDAKGRFRLPPVAPGSYRVFYDYPEAQSPRAIAETRMRSAVTVQLGEQPQQLDLRLKPR